MKVFVTGATGVLGRRVVPLLLAAGHDVTALARSPEKARSLESMGARPSSASLFDPASLGPALAGHDAVLNLATAIPALSKGAWPGAWRENDRIRTEGSRHVVDAARRAGIGHHVQESVTFTYADGAHAWIDESCPVDVVPMMRSALAAEAQAARFTDDGAVGVVLRFAMFYGPDSSHTMDWVRYARRGLSPVIGPPGAYGSYVHLDDAAASTVAALALDSGIYNVSEDEPVTKGELTEVAARVAGRHRLSSVVARASRLGGRKTEPLRRSQRISNGKIRSASSWRPTYRSIRDGWPLVAAEIDQETSHA